ncbi:GNAT family N-acetyltransferase [Galbibacter pacificus]|uniref:GNAT family N-acetyltransferase n=1 Tax=Galbibacter pacificus TaxID=2996052 RepID=A0ABT6FV23_9FLAO|nr:GNAT family N-acetyltransferase [Galbibacter pacificus]MDG3583407.1 GNAT family N-acetyltransferase [Galbibacter pacificus]MDG3587116.1 GNAT family N-acetyltransferase [Galbibacter pacificus]
MKLYYKNIEEKDLELVKEIYDWYIANSTATFHTDPITIQELKELLYFNHSLYDSFLIYADDELAGYCFTTHFKKRQAYNGTAEVTIYLKDGFGGKGIGKNTLSFLEEKAKGKGIKNLLGIITGDNTGSIALFERMGYFKCAHFKNVGVKFGKVLDVVGYQKEIQE